MAEPRRGYQTLRDMVFALVVVLAGVAVTAALLPRHSHPKVTGVDYLTTARAFATDSGLPTYVPDPQPAGWQANYARSDVTPALHVGFVLHSQRFARLDETGHPDDAFFADANVGPRPDGTVQVGSVSYERRRDAAGHVALVRTLPRGAVLTLSDGGGDNGASEADLVALAASLRQQQPS